MPEPIPIFMKATRPGKRLGCRTPPGCRLSRQWPGLGFGNLAMDVNVKLLESPDGKNHLIIIVHGLIDAQGLEEILGHVTETIRRLFNCEVLIDFEKASLRLEPSVIDELINELGPGLRAGNIAIALVSPSDTDGSEPVRLLAHSLIRQDLKVALFDTTKEAVTWLVST